MLTLYNHNVNRLTHLSRRDEVQAGVSCDECHAPMVVASLEQVRTPEGLPAVPVRCPRCNVVKEMLL